MSQSKRQSLIESLLNVLVGFVIALFSQILIFPFFDIHVSMSTNIYIALWFTAISIARSYCLRRAFNRFGVKYDRA